MLTQSTLLIHNPSVLIINIEKTSLHIAFSDLTLETDNEITYLLYTFLGLVFKKYYEFHFKLIIVFLLYYFLVVTKCLLRFPSMTLFRVRYGNKKKRWNYMSSADLQGPLQSSSFPFR